MLREKPITTLPGALVLVLIIATFVGATMWIIQLARVNEPGMIWMPILLILLAAISIAGLFVVNPNDGQAVLLFGDYLGTARSQGFHWVNPFTTRRRLSQRVRNFESPKLKVNDHVGNPIEIAAVVVWRVVDTAEALFEVDNFENFVHVQSEAALRNLATSYPYDAHTENEMSLRANTAEIAGELKREIQERLVKAGVEVIESRISHLAYAPEIASAMLQRQQASAIVAARTRIVEGAVGMVEMALERLAERQVVVLDDERKAAMVSNLLVVLCGDRHPQPVVNAGTLYH